VKKLEEAIEEIRRAPSFSQRLRANKCPHCGPGMGVMCRDVPVLHSERYSSCGLPLGPRLVVVRVMCRWCGGHSKTFREEAYS
jgi:hypothetical protein